MAGVSKRERWFNSTRKVIFVYLFISFLWIVLSDRLVASFAKDPELNLALQTYKGWIYVVVVAVFIYVEKTLAQRRINEGEIKYQEIVEHTNTAYFRMDREGRLVKVNDAWLKMYKYDSPNEVIGKRYDVFQVEGRGGEAEEIILSLLKGKTMSGEFSRLNKDGTTGFFTYHANPVKEDNKIVGFEAFMFDITDKKNFEKALIESESLFHNLFDYMVEGVAIHEMVFDKKGKPTNYRILDLNEAYTKNTGIKKEEAIGKLATEAYKVSKAPYLSEYYGAVKTGKPAVFDVFFEPLNKYFHISTFKISKNRFATVFWDMTSRKEYEKEISRLASFPQLNPMPIIEMDDKAKVIYKNPTYVLLEKKFGLEKSGSFLIPKDINNIISQLIRDGKTIRKEVAVNDNYYSEVITITDLKTIRIYAFDITRIREAENHLAQQNLNNLVEKQKLEAIVEGMADAVFVIDKKMKIVMVNKAMEELSGFSENELIGNTYNQRLKFYYEEAGKEVLTKPSMLFAGGDRDIPSTEGYFIRKDGSRVAVSGIGSPVKDNNGEVVLVVGVIRDVTKQRELNKMKTDFVSLASHQLRTPLTGIKWFVELLLDQFDSISKDQAKDYIVKVGQSNERMIQLVNDLLSVSKIDSGKISVSNLKEMGLKKILEVALDDLGKLIKEKKIKVIGLDHLEDLKIKGDETQLLQVFENILDNAVKYSENGDRLWVNVIKDNSKLFTISFKDEGVGIPANQQKRIFTKFFRGDNVSKYIPGSGLGLYVVKSLLENHGGKIWLESKEGIGTTVYVQLPFIINNHE